MAKAKRNFEENLEQIQSSRENEIKIFEVQKNEVNIVCDVIATDQIEVLTNNDENVSSPNSNANYISSENSTLQINTPNDNNWEDILNGELYPNCLPKSRGQISADQPVIEDIKGAFKPTLSNILRADSENSEMRQTKQEISLAMKSLQTNLLLISLVLLLSVLYFVP